LALANNVATFAAVVDLTSRATGQVIAELSNSYASFGPAFLCFSTASLPNIRRGGVSHSSAAPGGFRVEDGTSTDGAKRVIIYELRNDTTAGDVRIWENGTELSTTISTNTKTASAITNFRTDTFGIGARAASGAVTLALDGTIGPAFVINRALTSTEITDLTTWMAGEAGVFI
jgi:hypothetical protein